MCSAVHGFSHTADLLNSRTLNTDITLIAIFVNKPYTYQNYEMQIK